MKKMTALLLSAALLCPTLALAEDTVKIGIFEPMTGATAAGGSMEKEGFDLANELYPDVLGQKIELVYGDNKSDRAEATLAAQSLVDKGVVAVLGSYGSGLSMAGGRSLRRKQKFRPLTATGHQPDGDARLRMVRPHLLHRSVPRDDACALRREERLQKDRDHARERQRICRRSGEVFPG